MDRNLKEDIWRIWRILLNSKENFLYSKYLHLPETDQERNYLKSSRHFHFIRHSLWRLSIIELHKLLSKSDKDSYNLWTFLKNLETNNYVDHRVAVEQITAWKNQLNSKKSTIKTIQLLRNKIYAHTDPEKDTLDVDISFKDVEQIILLAEDVIRKIYHLLGSDILTETPIFETENFDIIKILAKEEEDRIKALYDLTKRK